MSRPDEAKGMKHRTWVLGVAFVGLFAALLLTRVPGALADTVLDFDVPALDNPGTISYAGGASPLVGLGIAIDRIDAISTPLHTGETLGCVGCTLSFTTGSFIASGPDTWRFAGGGSITITGSIPSLGISDATLLTGTFDSARVDALGDSLKLTGAFFRDAKDEMLLAHFGIPASSVFSGSFGINFIADGDPGDPFSSDLVLSGDVVNKLRVPEPGTAALLVSSMLPALMFTVSRRRRRA